MFARVLFIIALLFPATSAPAANATIHGAAGGFEINSDYHAKYGESSSPWH